MADSSSLRGQIEKHPQYKKLSPRAVKLFEKHKTDPSETALASTKGVLEQGGVVGRRTSVGRKGYLLLSENSLYWLGLRGSYDVAGISQLRVPLQFLGAKSMLFVFGAPFHTRRVLGIHIRKFVELNNLLARQQQASSAGAASSPLAQPNADVTEQIGRLAALKEQGHITAEEYERKKTELLDRL